MHQTSPTASPPSGGTSPPAPARGLVVQRVPLASLAPDPANARTRPEANVDAIVGSLRRWGQAEPLVVRAGTRRVVAGHGRLLAMKALVWTECDVIELDLTPTEAMVLGTELNRMAELAEWDDGALAATLQQLRAEDGDLDGIGYSPGEIEALLDELQRQAGQGDRDLDAVLLSPHAQERILSGELVTSESALRPVCRMASWEEQEAALARSARA